MILVTGFEAFEPLEENPSRKIVEELDGEKVNNYEIEGLVLPVVFDKCFRELKERIREENPDLVLNIGVFGKSHLELERATLNMKDAKQSDNEGNIPSEEKITDSGRNAYFSDLPFEEISDGFESSETELKVSPAAPDLFVCNNLNFHTLKFREENDINFKSGMLHIPPGEDQIEDIEGLDIEKTKDAVKDIIEIVI
jgi:pyroglutamyl-peptidase